MKRTEGHADRQNSQSTSMLHTSAKSKGATIQLTLITCESLWELQQTQLLVKACQVYYGLYLAIK